MANRKIKTMTADQKENVGYRQGRAYNTLEKLNTTSASFGLVVSDPPDGIYIGVDSTTKPKWSNGTAFTILDVAIKAIRKENVDHIFFVDKQSLEVYHLSREGFDSSKATDRKVIGRDGLEINYEDLEKVEDLEPKDLPEFLKLSAEELELKNEEKIPDSFRFPHLHLHTEFSFLDSAIKINDLMTHAAGEGFLQLAITDHGNLNGWFRFHREAKKFGILPIFGIEPYVTPDISLKGLSAEEKVAILEEHGQSEGKDKIKEAQSVRRRNRHVVILAKNQAGIKKLYKLHEDSYKYGFFYRPRIDYAMLESLAGDVIVMTACLGGVIPKLLLEDEVEEAIKFANRWKQIFKEDFFLEIQPNEIPEQAVLNKKLKVLGEELNIPLVATNDVHYTEEYLHITHDVLICMSQMQEKKNVYIDDKDRRRYDTTKLYLMDYFQMLKAFFTSHKGLGQNTIMEACRNAELIANRITGKRGAEFRERLEDDFKIGKARTVGPIIKEKLLPEIDIPDRFPTPNDYLEKLCDDGWGEKIVGRVPEEKHKEYMDRLEMELKEIFRLGFSEYFLVIFELVNWAKENNILVGPGRGSVAGSIVAYLLGITLVDPVKWDLMFSRFISADRIDLPDIDLDFPSTKRDDIKQYLRDKYGTDSVASVANFAAMKGKMVLKDVGRVHRIPLHELGRVAQHIITRASGDARGSQCLADAFKEFKGCIEFAKVKRNIPVLRFASRLEGQIRQKGVNAAGVLVSPGPLRDYVPVEVQPKTLKKMKDGDNYEYITAWDRIDVEDCGLLKIDILGIDGLTYIQETIRKVKGSHGIDIKLEDIPLDDPEIYQAMSEGKTLCVWQFESQGAVRTLRQLKPTTFEEVIATTALIRPGPLYSGMTARYIRAKHDPTSIRYGHELLKPILEPTAGQCIYQEQATRIVHDFAGFDWAEADAVRKCISKKMGKEYMQQYYQKYLEGTKNNGVSEDVAKKMWNAIGQFGQYAFNRSHSAAYSFLSYWTCYLKLKYPLEFMSSVLATEKDDEKVGRYIQESRRLGVQVFPANINDSGKNFESIQERNVIVAGLSSIKGVGPRAVEEIIKHRPYKSFKDFLLRVPSRSVNKKAIEVLVKTGAFGSFVSNRKQTVARLEGIGKWRKSKKNKDMDIEEFIEKCCGLIYNELPECEDYNDKEKTEILQELVNFPLKEHPVETLKPIIKRRFGLPTLISINELPKIYGDMEFSSRQVWVVGVCTRVQYQSVANWAEFQKKKEVYGASDNLEGTERRVKLNIDDGTEFVMLMTSPNQFADMDEERVKIGQLFLARAKLTGNFRMNTSHVINLSHYLYENGTHLNTKTTRFLENNFLDLLTDDDDQWVDSVSKSISDGNPVNLKHLHERIRSKVECNILGRAMALRIKTSKKGDEYAYIDLEDKSASMDVWIPPKLWDSIPNKEDDKFDPKQRIEDGFPVRIYGRLKPKQDLPEINVGESDVTDEEEEKKLDDIKFRRTATFIAETITVVDISNVNTQKVKKEKRSNVRIQEKEESEESQKGRKKRVKRVKQ